MLGKRCINHYSRRVRLLFGKHTDIISKTTTFVEIQSEEEEYFMWSGLHKSKPSY